MGHDVEAIWSGLKEGKSGVGFTTIFDASNFPTKISAEVQNWDIADAGEDADVLEVPRPAHQVRRRRGQAGRGAIGRARSASDPTRFGVYLGGGEGQQDFCRLLADDGRRPRPTATRPGQVHPDGAGDAQPASPSSSRSRTCRPGTWPACSTPRGRTPNCLTACAASSQAIGEATEIIRRGDADVMLSGGAHSMIHPFGVTGFNLLTALSTDNDEPTKASRAVRPHRDGFVLGEGAGDGDPRRARARQGARRDDLRRDRRLRLDRRRLPHHRHAPRRPRARSRCMRDGPGRRGAATADRSTTSTPTARAPP